MSRVNNPSAVFPFKHLLVILVVLVTADGVITQFLIRNRLSWELNPLLSPLVGEHFFIPLKMFGGFLAAWLLGDVHERLPRLALVATYCAVALYTGIVLWNIANFFMSRS